MNGRATATLQIDDEELSVLNLWSISGQSLANLWSIPGQSLVDLWPIPGQSLVTRSMVIQRCGSASSAHEPPKTVRNALETPKFRLHPRRASHSLARLDRGRESTKWAVWP